MYYLSYTSFIYRVEIIWYIFQICHHGSATFYHLLEGMSPTSVAELKGGHFKDCGMHTNALMHKQEHINKPTNTNRHEEANNSQY